MTDRVPRATDTGGLFAGDLAAGARVGEYRIETVHATRGHGHQYEAKHVVLPRRAAIHIAPQGMPQSISVDLLREACLLESIDHPGVPRLFECGLLDRRPWIATELVEGPSLATRADELSLRAIVEVMRDVAEILEHVHAHGIVHHAVLPEAIVFAQGRRFPLCLVGWSHARATNSLAPLPPLAKTRYAAPERRAGAEADMRADLYSLGVIVRELLARSPSDVRPPILEAVVGRMVDEDPARRPMAALVRDNAAWLAAQLGDSVPEPIEEVETEEILLRGPITSDLTPEITGEIATSSRTVDS